MTKEQAEWWLKQYWFHDAKMREKFEGSGTMMSRREYCYMKLMENGWSFKNTTLIDRRSKT